LRDIRYRIDEQIEKIFEETKSLQESIHREPELSNEEILTRNKVLDFITGIPVETFHCKKSNGLLVDICINPDFPTIAFRADMDALPLNESTDLPYKSQIPQKMHACGHDFHTAILAGLVRAIWSLRSYIKANVRLIFQPAEENSPEGGAKRIIEEGGLEGCSAIFGLHLWPELFTGNVGIKSGPCFAASDRFEIVIRGKSSHAAKPESGVDSIAISGNVLVALQYLISRTVSPTDQAVLTVGKIEGGERYNVLAETTRLYGTVRNTSEAVRKKLKDKLLSVVTNTAQMYGAKSFLKYDCGYPVLFNDKRLSEIVSDIIDNLKIQNISVKELASASMIAEDFSFYTKEIPGAFLLLGCSNPSLDISKQFPLHSSNFQADQNCIKTGMAALLSIAVNFTGLINEK